MRALHSPLHGLRGSSWWMGGALMLTACSCASGCSSTQDFPLAETHWAITQVYVEPEDPVLTPTAASIAFGLQSAVISTGCAPIQATVRYQDDTVEFGHLQVRNLTESCTGVSRFIHDNLLTLLNQPLSVRLHEDQEVSLTVKDGEELNQPSIRLSAISDATLGIS